MNTVILGDGEKNIFTSLGRRLFGGGDYSSRGYYSSKYGTTYLLNYTTRSASIFKYMTLDGKVTQVMIYYKL